MDDNTDNNADEEGLERSQLVFGQVLANSVKNIFFFGAGLGVIIFAGSFFRWVGLTLFAIFALIVALNVFQWLFTAGLMLLVLPGKLWHAVKAKSFVIVKGELYISSATFIQLIENAVYIWFCYYLYTYFYP